jgi:hypothetical protein
MRWRAKATEETRRMEKRPRCGNGQATTVGVRGAMRALTTTTTNNNQQSTNVWRQWRRTKTAGKRRGAVVEADE